MIQKKIVLALICSVAAVTATATTLTARRAPLHREMPPSARAEQRVRVQVLNATRTRGLARRAMLYLRDQGFDVVEVGTTTPTLDTTVVLDRSRHPTWAREVASSLGAAHVETRPDSSRYLDVTVLVGASWRPPAQPFYP
jgi:LytR cell envelope-related transcriptional attenuator